MNWKLSKKPKNQNKCTWAMWKEIKQKVGVAQGLQLFSKYT